MTPAEHVRAHLIAQGHASATIQAGNDWVCLVGGLSDALAAPQVAVMDTGGMDPLAAHNSTPPSRPGVQVLIRGTSSTFQAAALKARTVWSALRGASPPGIMLITPTSSPIWLGLDDANRPRWSLNFLLTFKEDQ